MMERTVLFYDFHRQYRMPRSQNVLRLGQNRSLGPTGPYWHFYTLSNGGFYMAPGDQPQYRLEWDGNGFSGDVSADAAGLIATLFMLGHMHEKYGEDQFAQLYAWASAYAAQHSEAGPIGAALD